MKAAVVCSCFDNRIDDRRSPSLPRFHGRNVAAISADGCLHRSIKDDAQSCRMGTKKGNEVEGK